MAFATGVVGCATSRPARVEVVHPEPRVEAPAAPAAVAPVAPVAPVEPPRPTGLRLVVEPVDARLFINGADYGPAGEALGPGRHLDLVPGVYRIVLSRPGYQTWRGEIAVKQAAEPIHVTLVSEE